MCLSKAKEKKLKILCKKMHEIFPNMPKKDYSRLKGKMIFDLNNPVAQNIIGGYKKGDVDEYDCIYRLVVAHIRHNFTPYDYLCNKLNSNKYKITRTTEKTVRIKKQWQGKNNELF